MVSKKSAEEKILADALAMLAANNVDTTEMSTIVETDYRNNDAVTVFASWPEHFKPNICRNCGKTFAVNKKSVGFCGDLCRREDWRKTTGLDWNRISTHDVWDSDPPMIINPQQYENLRKIVAWFNRSQEALASMIAQQKEQDRRQQAELDLFEDLSDLPETPQSPNASQESSVESPQPFSIFDTPPKDQGDSRTIPDSWIFG